MAAYWYPSRTAPYHSQDSWLIVRSIKDGGFVSQVKRSPCQSRSHSVLLSFEDFHHPLKAAHLNRNRVLTLSLSQKSLLRQTAVRPECIKELTAGDG